MPAGVYCFYSSSTALVSYASRSPDGGDVFFFTSSSLW